MAISCLPDNLSELANCFMGYGPVILKAIRIRLYCALLNSETMDCSIESLLAEANCILSSMAPGQMDAVETYLLCLAANNGGGGGGSPCLDFAISPPVAPPDPAKCGAALTIGYGDWIGFFWVWDNGFTDTWVQVPGGP